MSNRTFESGRARRERTLIAAGFVGPSGSGKTKSMLRFADGMRRVKPGPTYLVDTNLRRSLHHADAHDFQVVHLTAPFGPDSFGAAFEHCIKQGAARIIVDSMSDEWEGEGGILDAHEKKLDEMVARKLKRDPEVDEWKAREQLSDTAWIEPKRLHRDLRLWMWQQPVDWLLGYRAKEKTDRKKKDKGGTERVPLGWQPIGATDVIYDLLFKVLLPPMGDGRPNWTPSADAEKLLVKQPGWFRDAFKAHPQIDEELGELIARWADGGDIAAVPAASSTATSSRPTSSTPGLAERFDACTDHRAFVALEAEMRADWKKIPNAHRDSVRAAFDAAKDRCRPERQVADPRSIDADEARAIREQEAREARS
jgi:hypothetical protein